MPYEDQIMEAKKHADAYIQALYAVLPCLDLSIPTQANKAQAIIKIIQDMQRAHKHLVDPSYTGSATRGYDEED